MISIVLIVFNFLPTAKASDVGCCEKTIDNLYCQEVEDPGLCSFGFRLGSCNSHPNCQTGCCVTNDSCSYNTLKASCAPDSKFFPGNEMCNMENCKKICCVLQEGPKIMTQKSCEQWAVFQGFLPEIIPTSNLDTCKQFISEEGLGNFGCCEINNGNRCINMTSQSCQANHGKFNRGKKCSQVCSQCAGKTTGCSDDLTKVFYFDACGNIENIAKNCLARQGCLESDNKADCAPTGCGSYKQGDMWCGHDGWSPESLLKGEKPPVGWTDYMYICGPNNLVEIIPLSPGTEYCKNYTAANGKKVAERVAISETDCISLSDKESCEAEANQGVCFWVDNFTEFQALKKMKEWLLMPNYDVFEDWQTDIRGFEKATCLPRYPSQDTANCELGKRFSGDATKDKLITWSEKTVFGATGTWWCHDTWDARCYLGGATNPDSGDTECAKCSPERGQPGQGLFGWQTGSPKFQDIMACSHIKKENEYNDCVDSVERDEDDEIAKVKQKISAMQGRQVEEAQEIDVSELDDPDADDNEDNDVDIDTRPDSENEYNDCVDSVEREAIWSTAMAERCRQLGKCGAYRNWANTSRSSSSTKLKRDRRYVVFMGGLNLGDLGRFDNSPDILNDPEINSPFTNNPFYSTNRVRINHYYFYCLPWAPKSGSEDCGLCDQDPLKPCNEQRCAALGQSCSINARGKCSGPTAEDPVSPTSTCNIKIGDNPAELGCFDNPIVENWKKIKIIITTSENAQCIYTEQQPPVLDFLNPENYLPDPDYKKNHIKEISFTPEEEDVEKTLTYDCQDESGNSILGSPQSREIRFTIKKYNVGDSSPPILDSTDPINESLIYLDNQNKMEFRAYLDEPSLCRWDTEDLPFEQMPIANELNASDGTGEPENIKFYNSIPINLTLEKDVINFVYLRCNDTMNNTNPLSYIIIYYPSKPLYIDTITPNEQTPVLGCVGTQIKKTFLNVTTSGGNQEGVSTCYWFNSEKQRWVKFTETESTEHSAEIPISSTNSIRIKCSDSASTKINTTIFSLQEDTKSPLITRFLREGSTLMLQTDEPATCAFINPKRNKILSCAFNASDGLKSLSFDSTGDLEHTLSLENKNSLYVKCYDSCGNGNIDASGFILKDCAIIHPQDI